MSAAKGKQFRERIAVDASRLAGARGRLSRYLADQGVEPAAARQIVLCASEALSNAVQHSGSSDPIVLEAGLCDGRITISVSDRGTGMGDVCVDPTLVADRREPSGRGFFLIWSYMDDLEVMQDCGTVIRMSKQVDPDAEACVAAADGGDKPVPGGAASEARGARDSRGRRAARRRCGPRCAA